MNETFLLTITDLPAGLLDVSPQSAHSGYLHS